MLLELKKIKKYFPIKKGLLRKTVDCVRAVDDVDLSILQGENLGLVGESGCGKTTLGRLILKLIPMDEGEIIFNGRDISRISNRQMRFLRKDLQMIFQDPYNSLDPRFTVRDIILEAMIYDKTSGKAQKEERVKELLRAVRLSPDMSERFPHEFSGGERQRIAIARALALNPKLLILDEAVSSLDVLVQDEIIRLLMELQKKFNLTYLFISHNLRVVKKIGHRIGVMHRGKIVELASAEEIFKNPLHPYTRELLSAAIEYKASKSSPDIFYKRDARLTDRGNGHMVLS